jgi:hypothetical protein
MNRQFSRVLSLGALGVGIIATACFPDLPQLEGQCRTVDAATLDCTVEGYEQDVLLEVGLVGYSCTGEQRPDYDATYDEGFPTGTLCASKGELGDGSQGYCCTPQPVDCAYDPVSDCAEGEDGYECRGTNRPESLNASINCGNGIRHGELTQYCCSGEPIAPLCQLVDSAGCRDGLLGFLCEEGGHPRGEHLGANKSRPDHYNFTCSVPEPAPNPEFNTTCCFAPPLVLDGGSCITHDSVPGCEPGRFGFSCYGRDTPDEGYLSVNCPESGVAGTSVEGYPATLYCCDFIE